MVAVRTVVQQHDGTRHGPITRVIDPAGLGKQLKPFIFYVPPPSHSVAWAFPFDGAARVAGVCASQRLLHLSDHGVIDFASGSQAVRILVGSARPHEYPLVLGPHSVHTSEATLALGLQQIRRVGESLKRQGRL